MRKLKIPAILAAFLLLCGLLTAPASAARSTAYTYTISVDGEYIRTQDAYIPSRIYLNECGLSGPQDVFVHGKQLYVADTGNARVLIYDMETDTYRELKHPEFVKPMGLFVDDDGELYVADAEAQAVFRSGLAPAERDVFDAHVAAAVLRSVCAVAEQLYAAAGDGDDARATADRLCGLVASALGRHSSSNFGGGSVAVPATLPCSASVPDLRKAGMGPLQQPQQSSPSASGTATPAHGRRRHLVTSGTLLPFLDDGKEKDSDDSGKVCPCAPPCLLFFFWHLHVVSLLLLLDTPQKAKIQQLAGRPVVCGPILTAICDKLSLICIVCACDTAPVCV